MKIRTVVFAFVAVTAILAVFQTTAYSKAPLTAKELIESGALREYGDALKKGEIVIIKRPEPEADNELAVVVMILVPAPLDVTVDTLQRQSTVEGASGILAAGELKSMAPTQLDASFAGVGFTAEEKEEVERLMAIAPGDDFNFSRDEISFIRQRAQAVKDGEPKSASARKTMSAAMRDVLKGRYVSYRKKGLKGLEPYQFGPSKQVAPSTELIDATESMRLVKERFPDYYACLLDFPGHDNPAWVHQFYWAKQKESGRPLFILKHWVLDIRPEYALITERRYYLSHTLNSLQVVIGCLPYNDGTLVALLNQTFTEKVNMKIGKKIAKSIGYRQVEKNIRPMFESLRSELNPRFGGS